MGAKKDHAGDAGITNYLVDLDHAVIVDVEATAPIRQAEAGAARDMIERTRHRFGLYPEKLVADTAYGSAETLSWLVESEGIAVFRNCRPLSSGRRPGSSGR